MIQTSVLPKQICSRLQSRRSSKRHWHLAQNARGLLRSKRCTPGHAACHRAVNSNGMALDIDRLD